MKYIFIKGFGEHLTEVEAVHVSIEDLKQVAEMAQAAWHAAWDVACDLEEIQLRTDLGTVCNTPEDIEEELTIPGWHRSNLEVLPSYNSRQATAIIATEMGFRLSWNKGSVQTLQIPWMVVGL